MRSGKVLKQVWLMMVSIDVGEIFIIPSQKRPEASMSQLPQLWEEEEYRSWESGTPGRNRLSMTSCF